MTKVYAGIGPRKAPFEILPIMTNIAEQLAKTSWLLRSGHGERSDEAFEVGAPKHLKEVWVPYIGFNNSVPEPHYHEALYSKELMDIAEAHHNAWDKCDNRARALLGRNVHILLGENLHKPVDMVVYWQPSNNRITDRGGTNHSLRIASTFGIKTFNINEPDQQRALMKHVLYVEESKVISNLVPFEIDRF